MIELAAVLAVLVLELELRLHRSAWLFVFASRAMARAP